MFYNFWKKKFKKIPIFSNLIWIKYEFLIKKAQFTKLNLIKKIIKNFYTLDFMHS